MRKLFIGLLALTSVTAFANERIEHPTYNGKLFRSNSSANSICKQYGYSKATSKETSDNRLVSIAVGSVNSIANLLVTHTTRGVSSDDQFNYALEMNLVHINKQGEIQELPYFEEHRWILSVECK